MGNKESLALEATRREVLAGMAGAAAASSVPLSGVTNAAEMIANPRLALIKVCGLGGAIDYQDSRRMSERLVLEQAVRSPEQIKEALEILRGGMRNPDWPQIGYKLADLSQGKSDKEDWQILRSLSYVYGDRNDDELINLQSGNPKAIHHMMHEVYNQWSTYVNSYRVQREMESVVRQNPTIFRPALAELVKDYPEIFHQKGSAVARGFDAFMRPERQITNLPSPDMIGERITETVARLTGTIPHGLPTKAQQRIQKFFDEPDRDPFLSPQAEAKRQLARMEHMADAGDLHIEPITEEIPYYSAGNFTYSSHEGCNPLPGYLVTTEHAQNLRDLAELINAHYPIEPIFSNTFRYENSRRAYVENGLHVINPPPELAELLQSLTKPDTRVNAVARIKALQSPTQAID